MDKFIPLSSCVQHSNPAFTVIIEQLPQGLRDRLYMELITDSFYLACRARFITRSGTQFETRLEPIMVDGAQFCLGVPEAFVAHLCLVVR